METIYGWIVNWFDVGEDRIVLGGDCEELDGDIWGAAAGEL
jgi:hypothetical protein